jgi:phage tail sheath protein FI
MIVQTPGVYITERENFPAFVGGVSTAIPAFIGCTEIANLHPVRIKTMFEFESNFGASFSPIFNESNDPNHPVVPNKRFFLYDTLDLYFRNGGGPCYIISAGTFALTDSSNIENTLNAALGKVDVLDEVTLLIMPDLHFQYNNGSNVISYLSGSGSYNMLSSALISKCASLKDKFTLLDYLQPHTTSQEIRSWINPSGNELKYGALYFPWLRNARPIEVSYNQITLTQPTGSVQETAMNNLLADIARMDTRFGGPQTLAALNQAFTSKSMDVSNKTKLTDVFRFLYQLVTGLDDNLLITDPELNAYRNAMVTNNNFTNEVKNLFWFSKTLIEGSMLSSGFPTVAITPNDTWISSAFGTYSSYNDLIRDYRNLRYTYPNPISNQDIIRDLLSDTFVKIKTIFAAISNFYEMARTRETTLENQLFFHDPAYSKFKDAVINHQKEIPSQGAIAGLYCKNDRERGVWKSPANITVQGIEKPLFEVSNTEQDHLNVDIVSGKSINVIRTFTGKGALVWGARTLDGNSNEWRYIAIRRFFSFAEESIKKTMENFVFESNNALTWVKIKATITSFLVDQWKSGALVGNTMNEAFFVNIGENTTSPTEILNGIINVQIGMAVARPAEFIILEFSHSTKS